MHRRGFTSGTEKPDMPYEVRKAGSKYQIVKKDTGKVVGTSDSKAKAEASIRARYAGEGGSNAKRRK
jgi:hypothetical protein